MPKNKGKGGKNRRRGKNENDAIKRELILKEEGQEYGVVLKMLGNGRLEAQIVGGGKTLGHIRGKMRKKVWIGVGDIILLSEREFEEGKTDVIAKYNPDEVHQLKKQGHLPENVVVPEGDDVEDSGVEEDGVRFDVDIDDI
ncbi:Translation initiation factor 1A [Mycoemilia scoparia]|uniref:Translation initiation factor 1A n=1 Tax=Mycoemilia scoparia TaxID=417184 RepID=A0A9W8A355_9FUNG|nr:Translation initiation factor 1A [Mycoemilia scoparia]